MRQMPPDGKEKIPKLFNFFLSNFSSRSPFHRFSSPVPFLVIVPPSPSQSLGIPRTDTFYPYNGESQPPLRRDKPTGTGGRTGTEEGQVKETGTKR